MGYDPTQDLQASFARRVAAAGQGSAAQAVGKAGRVALYRKTTASDGPQTPRSVVPEARHLQLTHSPDQQKTPRSNIPEAKHLQLPPSPDKPKTPRSVVPETAHHQLPPSPERAPRKSRQTSHRWIIRLSGSLCARDNAHATAGADQCRAQAIVSEDECCTACSEKGGRSTGEAAH